MPVTYCCDSEIIDQFFRQNISGCCCIDDVRLQMTGRRLDRPESGDALSRYAESCR
jgi:hypothetical protein